MPVTAMTTSDGIEASNRVILHGFRRGGDENDSVYFEIVIGGEAMVTDLAW
ncbi:MAG: hypothetical protein ABI880_00895 [Acidobacteriota bacterium]